MGHGLTALFGVRQILQGADDWGQYASRLQIAAGGVDAATVAQGRLLDISDRVYKSFGTSAELYIRSADSLRELGYTSSETLGMVEALSYGLTVSAADQQRSASVVDAWSKSILMGKMGMEEFNTIVAGAPRLQKALADALGTTNAGLMEMVRNGELTADKLVLVTSQIEQLGREADSMPVAVLTDAVTRIGNAMTAWAGTMSDATGASRVLVDGLGLLAANFDLVANAGLAVAAVLVTRKVAALVATSRATALQAAENAVLAQSELVAARAVQAKAAAVAAATPLLGGSTAATTALTAANTRLAAAEKAVAAANAARLGIAGRLMGLLGGPIGMVTTALSVGAAAWVTYGLRAEQASRMAAAEAGAQLSDLRQAVEGIERMSREAYDRQLVASRRMQAQLVRDMLAAEAEYQRISADFNRSGAPRQIRMGGQLDAAYAAMQAARDSLREIDGIVRDLEGGFNNIGTASAEAMLSNEQYMTKAQAQAKRLAEGLKSFDDAIRATRQAGGPQAEALIANLQRQRAAWEAEQRAAMQAGKTAEKTRESFAAMMNEQSGLSKSFHEEWELLNKAYANGWFGGKGEAALARLHEAQRLLLEQQPLMREMAEEEKRAIEGRARALGSLVDEETRRATGYKESSAALREEIETLGMTAEQLARYKANKLETAAAAHEHAAAELELASMLLDMQGILPDVAAEYLRLAAARRASADGAREAAGLTVMAEGARKTEDAFASLTRAVEGFGKDAAAAMVDWALTGKTSSRDMVDSVIADLARLVMYQKVTKPLADAVSGIDWGGLFSSFFPSAKGNAFAGSGPVHAFAAGGAFGDGEVLTRPTFFRFAQGGAFRNGVAGEAGPEAALPLKRLSNGKLGVYADVAASPVSYAPQSPAPRNVNVRITNTGSKQMEARGQASMSGDGNLEVEIMLYERLTGRLIRETQKGGGLAPVLEGKYNLNPAAGAWR